MAYQGRKVFQAGEVLASSDMNSTVDQTVMVFADASARNTAIPSPTEGMLVYLKDTDEVLKYDGTNWIEIIETADDLITTEGDLIIGGASGVAERLPIGTNETFLKSDGTTAIWAAVDTGAVSNNFVIDMNNTSNNTADIGETKPAGPYSMSFSSGDSIFDVYLLDSNGDSVGYSNSTSITASADFTTVVILGVVQDEIISFNFQGIIANADGEGDEPGAGAYLTSISPTDLPTIDDTATVTGGNFGADTQIFFDSGTTSLSAKNITINNSTELIVTRPDNLDAGLDPWTLRAVTSGVPEPTGTNANLLVDEVTAGDSPVWVTTSPLVVGTVNEAYTDTLEATDPDGGAVTYSIVSGSLPTGLSLNSSTGVISGTPTAGGQTFTAGATDDGGSQTTREFTISIQLATGGTVTTDDNFIYHTFTSSDDFEALVDINIEALIVAGGGGGSNDDGGGGAGGLLNPSSTLTAGIYPVTVGSGAQSQGQNGGNSSLNSVGTAIGGGGAGDDFRENGKNGGSGGGAGRAVDGESSLFGGSGTAGQGNDGGNSPAGQDQQNAAGGGGASEAGDDKRIFGTDSTGVGGAGLQFLDFANATNTGDSNGFYAGGGSGNNASSFNVAGVGGVNDITGGGGPRGDYIGRQGVVIVRY